MRSLEYKVNEERKWYFVVKSYFYKFLISGLFHLVARTVCSLVLLEKTLFSRKKRQSKFSLGFDKDFVKITFTKQITTVLIVRGRSPRTDYSRNEWDLNVCKDGGKTAQIDLL